MIHCNYNLDPKVQVMRFLQISPKFRGDWKMKKQAENLFKIGEVIKIMGITRKALLVYEEMGLLTPAVKDEESGYRYYSADNMTQIRSIRSLQALRLSLKEVAEYYYDTDNIDTHLDRLMKLRASLDRNIQMLQVRAAKKGDLTVHKTSLPRQVCFCRRYVCENISDAANKLRDTYIDAAHTGRMSMLGRMFTMRMSPMIEKLDIMCCIPVEDDYVGQERMEFAETQALCIYYHGPYEGTGTAIRALMQYVNENNIETVGPFRNIYMEGPPNRGENKEDYITQIAVPIKG